MIRGLFHVVLALGILGIECVTICGCLVVIAIDQWMYE